MNDVLAYSVCSAFYAGLTSCVVLSIPEVALGIMTRQLWRRSCMITRMKFICPSVVPLAKSGLTTVYGGLRTACFGGLECNILFGHQ